MPIRFAGRNRAMAIGLAGLLALGVVGAGSVALAEGPGTGSGTPTTQDGTKAHHPKIVRATVADIVKASGLSKDVFKQGLKDGKSLSQIITENGGNPASVEAAVLADITTRVNQAVTDGKLTQEQANMILEKAPTALSELMDRTPKPHDGSGNGNQAGKGVVKNVLQTTAQTLNMDVKDLAKELKGGKTIAQVATEHGSTAQAVIDALDANANAAIDKAVADGKLDASRADQAKAKALAAITKLVNEGGPRHGAANGNGQSQ